MRWHYEYAGLRVSSEIEISEWRVFERAGEWEQADVSIVLEDAREPLTAFSASSISRKEYEFYLMHVGAYRIRGGCEIVVTPERGAGAREVRLFLLGTAWGALCYQRGIFLLHASVVRVNEYALAFCGPSGAGKSSLAAAMVARGYEMVSDDLCRVDFADDGHAVVYPSAPRMKLWEDALAQFQYGETELEHDYFRAHKFHVPLREAIPSEPFALRAVYVLEWGELNLERLRGAYALQHLARNATYRAHLLEPMGLYEEHLARMAELARRVRVFALTRPKAWETLERTIELFM